MVFTIGGWTLVVGCILTFIEVGPLPIRTVLLVLAATAIAGALVLERHLVRADRNRIPPDGDGSG
jgi:hypothetical protein